jgi:hypothetical protein
MASVSIMSQFGPGLVRAVPLVSKASQALPILWARACRRSLSGTTNSQLNEDARSMMGATGGTPCPLIMMCSPTAARWC